MDRIFVAKTPNAASEAKTHQQTGIVQTNKAIGYIILVYPTSFVMKAISHYRLTIPVKSSVFIVSNRSRKTSRKSKSVAGKHG